MLAFDASRPAYSPAEFCSMSVGELSSRLARRHTAVYSVNVSFTCHNELVHT